MKPRSPAMSSADVVVPMPRFSGSSWPRWYTAEPAAWIAFSRIARTSCGRTVVSPLAKRSIVSLFASTAARNSCTASCDATSPEACPPIPSATTKSCSFLSTRKLSSLISRFLPTSVAAEKLSSMGVSVLLPWVGEGAQSTGR